MSAKSSNGRSNQHEFAGGKKKRKKVFGGGEGAVVDARKSQNSPNPVEPEPESHVQISACSLSAWEVLCGKGRMAR